MNVEVSRSSRRHTMHTVTVVAAVLSILSVGCRVLLQTTTQCNLSYTPYEISVSRWTVEELHFARALPDRSYITWNEKAAVVWLGRVIQHTGLSCCSKHRQYFLGLEAAHRSIRLSIDGPFWSAVSSQCRRYVQLHDFMRSQTFNSCR